MGKRLSPILAPIVLRAFKKRANSGGRSATIAAGGGSSGLAGGLLTSILDRDGDGNIRDDVANMVISGGADGRSSGGGGLLMKLISMLFGRKG